MKNKKEHKIQKQNEGEDSYEVASFLQQQKPQEHHIYQHFFFGEENQYRTPKEEPFHWVYVTPFQPKAKEDNLQGHILGLTIF